MWDIIHSHSHSLWFFHIRSFEIVLHRCERFSFSNVNLFLLVFSSSSFGTTAPSISVIPLAISECHLYMSLADSTVLITSEYISLVLVWYRHYYYSQMIVLFCTTKLTSIYFHSSNPRHKNNKWLVLIRFFINQMPLFNYFNDYWICIDLATWNAYARNTVRLQTELDPAFSESRRRRSRLQAFLHFSENGRVHAHNHLITLKQWTYDECGIRKRRNTHLGCVEIGNTRCATPTNS